jgi:hypothetical protein
MIPPAASRRLSHSEHNLFPKFWVTLSQLAPMARRGGITDPVGLEYTTVAVTCLFW